MNEHVHEWRWNSEHTEDGIDCRLCAEEGYDPANWMYSDEVIRRLNAFERLEAENKALRDAGQGMMDIAETAMPDTYFQSDSRVNTMRALLAVGNEFCDCEAPRITYKAVPPMCLWCGKLEGK